MGNFIVSARKYRPQRFDEVVGQQHVSQTLKNALRNDHLAHAFLFCGPRGVGKTTCARILAKVLNCEQPTADFEPCNTCGSCRSFNENASFNITELDAASNNSVEHIRALIEQVRFQPQQGQYKVFIIDEVHMLSSQAFNAFLKTLEEPPPYAIFILATTEKHKILPTILSRCQIFDFRRIQPTDVVTHLLEICEQESIEADADALHIIGQKADGALRDALSIFDRIVAYSGDRISYEDVILNLNVLDYDYYFRVVDALLVEDQARVLEILDTVLRHGFETDLFMNGLAEHVRNLLVCKDPQTLPLLEVSDTLRSRYQRQAQLCPSDLLLTVLNLANDCDINYRLARNKRLHTEIYLLRMCHVRRAFRLSEAQLTADAPTPANGQPAAPTTEKKSPHPNREVVLEEPTPTYQAPDPTPTTEPEATATPSAPEPTVADTVQPSAVVTSDSPAAAPIATPSPRRRPSSLRTTDLMAAVQEDAQEAAALAVQELDAAAVQQAWQSYREAARSDSLRLQMEAAHLHTEGIELTVKVGSLLAASTLRDDRGIDDYLREQLQLPGLIMRIEIDEALRTETATKPRPRALSSRDKFLFLRDKNPAVEELRKRFDLRPDDD